MQTKTVLLAGAVAMAVVACIGAPVTDAAALDASDGEVGALDVAASLDVATSDASVIVEPDALDAATRDVAPRDANDSGAVGACANPGGAVCGVDVGGEPGVLYTCRDGLRVPLERCAMGCDRMPPGVRDRCVQSIGDSDIPASLIDALDAAPYVEGNCVDVMYAGWPYRARRCTYSAGGITTTVTVANPTPNRVARWIMDAAGVIPSLDALHTSDRASWEQGLVIIARQLMGQSSRIFPLEGGIIENLGSGYVNYPFRMGVTDGCSTGCYCRINSLHRTELCSYVGVMGRETEANCLTRVGSRGLTDGWGAQCQGNHERSWSVDRNDHFRAKAWIAQQALSSRCGRTCAASDVLAVLRTTYQ